MSAKALAWAREVPGLTPTIKLLLILLADHANQHPSHGTAYVCWPSQEILAKDGGVSTRTVIRALAELEKRGLIARQRQYRDDGYRRADLYFMAVDGLGDNLSGENSSHVTPVAILGDTGGGSYVTPVSQQNSKKNQREQEHSSPSAPMAGDEGGVLTLLPSPAVPTVGRPTAQTVLADYIDWRKTQGSSGMSPSITARLGKAIKEAVESGIPSSIITAALRAWHMDGKGPASLPAFIDKAGRSKTSGGRPDDWMNSKTLDTPLEGPDPWI